VKLSIVPTLYCSAPYIGEFHARASAAAEAVGGNDYEVLLVNDGSREESLNLEVALTRDDPQVTIVDLSRKFGHHKSDDDGFTGVVDMYLSKEYSETKKRPLHNREAGSWRKTQ